MPMKSPRAAIAIVLLAVLGAVLYGWWSTALVSVPGQAARAGVARSDGRPLVDRSALDTANRLLPLASSADEQRLAENAVAAADHLLDLAYADALREATEHPAPLSAEAQAAHARLAAAAQRLVVDNAQILALGDAAAQAKGGQDGALEGELALARAQFEVDQDEFNQAERDLVAAGGDQRARIQMVVAEHQAAAPKAAAPAAVLPSGPGLVHQLERWMALRQKDQALAAARAQAAGTVAALATQRASLARRIATQTAGAATSAAPGTGAPGTAGAAPRAKEVSAVLLAAARQISADQKALASVDSRSAAAQELVRLYDDWRVIGAGEAARTVHRALLAVALILGVCVLLLFFNGWLRAAFDRLQLDRRQVEALRAATTVTLRVAAVVFIALVVIGPPTQLGTFLGLTGAGLTVALKDFLVAFVGWLVLMGRNGIRLGDWVEIDGVTGEVVQLGMFHTVLLETGNWNDPGHPTGRRVTFTNSFAIQGHYFNFSTTGQWLWDELQLVVPAEQDLYALVEAISQAVKAATADNARAAEEEWRRAAPSRKTSGFTAEPAINVKPVLGGTEISLRYITRANERHALRGKLYQAAVDLLRGKPGAAGH
jgi:small-conductance mechanosensitive channel